MLATQAEEHFQKMRASLGELCNSLDVSWILRLQQ